MRRFCGRRPWSSRLVELRQRQRRAQFERTCALFAGDGDRRLQIARGALRVGGLTAKPRFAVHTEQLALLPAKVARTNVGDEIFGQGERFAGAAVSDFRLGCEYPYEGVTILSWPTSFNAGRAARRLSTENGSPPDIDRDQRSNCSAAGAQVRKPVSATSLSR
jgi:hypothetical protein